MRGFLAKRLLQGALSSSRSCSPVAAAGAGGPFRSVFSPSRRYAVATSLAQEAAETVTFPREGPGVSYGLNWALAGRGVIVKDKAFYNLKSSELQKNGVKTIERLSGLPIYVRGKAVSGASEISKAQLSKLLKQVTTQISSIPNVFVQDGAIGSFSKCDAKVCIISDSPSAVLSLSSIICRTPNHVISRDSCPLTVYVATSVSPSTGEILGLGSQASNGFLVADFEGSSLILCGKAFTDADGVKAALSALAAPFISAGGGLPLSARPLAFGDSLVLLFASEDTIKSCVDLHQNLVSADAGVVLSSFGVAPFFQTADAGAPSLFKKPASVIFASADSSGVLPPISKLSPGQAAYHFLAGYQDGKFVPTYSNHASPVDPLELAKSLLSQLKDNEIPSFLVNVNAGGKHIAGKDLVDLVRSSLSRGIPESSLGTVSDPKVGDLKEKYKSFLSGKFQEIPEEFTF